MITTLINRPRLLDRINRPSLAPVTLITAPAGYGKSTLARQWAASFPGPVAYVTLRPESNTLSFTLTQVMNELRHAMADSPWPDTAAPTPEDIGFYCKDVLRDNGAIGIVLDDYHAINSPDCHDALSAWLYRLPPNFHVLILSRTMPPLILGRLRVHGKVRHLTEADLSFTGEEVAHLTGPAGLSSGQIRHLTARTEGWITGIHLALLAAAHDDKPDRNLDHILATALQQQWLDDYIVEEVLNTLPDDLREFVLHTSILEALIPELCDAMLSIDTSARLLQQLERHLVFVTRSPEAAGNLTYHQLFAEAVERISHRFITAGVRRQHHLRAAHWFKDHDRQEYALNHALKAEAWDMVERLTTTICQFLSDNGHHHATLFWLGKLPLRIRRANPQFSWWYVKALMGVGRWHDGEQELEKIRPLLETSDTPLHRGYLAHLDGSREVFAGENDQALRSFYTFLHNLSPDALIERLQAWVVVYQLESLRGNDDAAAHAYRQASSLTPHFIASESSWPRLLESNRANHYAFRADLVTAEALYRHQLNHLPVSQEHLGERYRGFLSMIYLEWNELERAMTEIQRILEELEDGPTTLVQGRRSLPLVWRRKHHAARQRHGGHALARLRRDAPRSRLGYASALPGQSV
ncbi:MAG TPA: hypothetical protein VNZ58_07085 [Thermomicrobiales bacterium]|nr:hypothetical protein [Thermomicrobiales bacterium]